MTQKVTQKELKEIKDGMDKLCRSVENLKKDFTKSLEKGDKRNEERWKEIMIEVKLMREKHEQERKEWTQEKEELNRRIERLEFEKERKDREERRNNVVIKGESFGNENLEKVVSEFLKDKINVEGKVKKAVNIKTKENRIITIAELESIEMKKEVMIKKKLLGNEKVYIDDDMTFKERAIQSRIREIAKKKKKEGSEVKVSYMKICVDGMWLKWNEYKNRFEQKGTSSSNDKDIENFQ